MLSEIESARKCSIQLWQSTQFGSKKYKGIVQKSHGIQNAERVSQCCRELLTIDQDNKDAKRELTEICKYIPA